MRRKFDQKVSNFTDNATQQLDDFEAYLRLVVERFRQPSWLLPLQPHLEPLVEKATRLGPKRKWLRSLQRFDQCLRQLEIVVRGDAGGSTFSKDDDNDEISGASFVCCEDVVELLLETKSRVEATESPAVDVLPAPDVAWKSDARIDAIHAENLLQYFRETRPAKSRFFPRVQLVLAMARRRGGGGGGGRGGEGLLCLSMDQLVKTSYRLASYDRDRTGVLYRNDFEDEVLWTEEEIDDVFYAWKVAEEEARKRQGEEVGSVEEKQAEEDEDDDDNIAAELSAFAFDLTLSTRQLADARLPRRLHRVDIKEFLLNLSFDADEERGWAKALTVVHGEPLWPGWLKDDGLRVKHKSR